VADIVASRNACFDVKRRAYVFSSAYSEISPLILLH